MLKSHITSLINNYLGHTPTQGQKALIESLSEFIQYNSKNDAFLLKGYAGTGKTSVISALVKTMDNLKVRYVLLAPTGRAAKVLSSYSGSNASTIHKKIYRQKSSSDGFGAFQLDKNLHTNTFFIVDEASMISDKQAESSVFGSGKLLDDLIEYVFTGTNCRLILTGDTAQLPPVGFNISPALKKEVIENYLLVCTEVVLTDIVRQSLDSGILLNATNVRNMISEKPDGFPKFVLRNFEDIIHLSGADLTETISGAYDTYGIDECMVVTRSNKRANQFNMGIRNQILWREEEICTGDYLMVVKNNYTWLPENEKVDFIANGDIVEIVRIEGYHEQYGFRFADVLIRFIDYDILEFPVRIMLDILTAETPALSEADNKKLFQEVAADYSDITSKKQRWEKIKKDPFFSALQVKFAYAVTCHKAQGGQWKAVFVDQGFVNEDMINTEYLRWLYTALTRATEKLYLVNFRKEFFGQGELPDW